MHTVYRVYHKVSGYSEIYLGDRNLALLLAGKSIDNKAGPSKTGILEIKVYDGAHDLPRDFVDYIVSQAAHERGSVGTFLSVLVDYVNNLDEEQRKTFVQTFCAIVKK